MKIIFALLFSLAPTSQALATSSSSPSLNSLQDALLAKIEAVTPLKKTDFAIAFSASAYGDWYDEASPQHLTGVARYTVDSLHSIDCWMGPSNDIPNSLLSFGACEDGKIRRRVKE